jgi:hypothetical protein
MESKIVVKQVTNKITTCRYYPDELTEDLVQGASRIVFEKGEVEYPDEGAEFNDGRVYTSSMRQGIVEWDEDAKCYVKFYHYQARHLGQLLYVEIETVEEISREERNE